MWHDPPMVTWHVRKPLSHSILKHQVAILSFENIYWSSVEHLWKSEVKRSQVKIITWPNIGKNTVLEPHILYKGFWRPMEAHGCLSTKSVQLNLYSFDKISKDSTICVKCLLEISICHCKPEISIEVILHKSNIQNYCPLSHVICCDNKLHDNLVQSYHNNAMSLVNS